MAIFHKEPLLFNAKEFSPSSNINNVCKNYGIGKIDKVLECTITESSEEYTLEMDVHRSCNVFNDLVKFNLILADGQLFRIFDTEYDSYKQTKNVYAKHISYDLDFDSFYDLKYKENNKDIVTVINTIAKKSQYSNIAVSSNLGRFKTMKIKDDLQDNTLFEGLLDVLEKLKEYCAEEGNEIDIEIKRDNNKIAFYLYEANKDYSNSTYKDSAGSGKDTGIRLDIQKIKTVNITENGDNFCTKVIAKGKDNAIVKDITHPTLGKNNLPFWITKVVSFPDEATTAKLRKLGQAHIIVNSLNIKNIRVDLDTVTETDFFKKITAYQNLELYDKVWIKHPDISDTYISFRIVKIEKDINGNLKTLEFGELNNDFAKTLKNAIKKYS